MRTYACERFATLSEVYEAACSCTLTEGEDDAFVLELIDQASDMLAFLSGGRMSGRCRSTLWPLFKGSPCTGPYDWSTASTPELSFRTLPLWGPELDIVSVVIDGTTVNPSRYKIIDGFRLAFLDGDWPTDNNLLAADGAPGTFTVQIETGWPVDVISNRAAIELVCEIASDYLTGESSLPEGTRSANLQGVSITLEDRAEALRENASTLPKTLRFLAIHAANGRTLPSLSSPDLAEGWSFHTRTGASGS